MYAVLLNPRTLRIAGTTFEQGKPTPIGDEMAALLGNNPRFKLSKTAISDKAAEEVVSRQELPKSELRRLIREAAERLDASDSKLFRADGRPTVEAITALLELDVTDKDITNAIPSKAIVEKTSNTGGQTDAGADDAEGGGAKVAEAASGKAGKAKSEDAKADDKKGGIKIVRKPKKGGEAHDPSTEGAIEG